MEKLNRKSTLNVRKYTLLTFRVPEPPNILAKIISLGMNSFITGEIDHDALSERNEIITVD